MNNSDFLVGMLFQAHSAMTLNNPLIMNVVKGDLRNLKDVVFIKDTELIFENVMKEFSEKILSYGTVHYNPKFWKLIFEKYFYDNEQISNYIKIKSNNGDLNLDNYEYTLELPNGCCTTDCCPLKTFYEIYNYHMLNHMDE